MLAGVGAVDLALLVVGADDGWMPQSEEHLAILELLGVRTVSSRSRTPTRSTPTRSSSRSSSSASGCHASSPGVTPPIVVCDSVSGSRARRRSAPRSTRARRSAPPAARRRPSPPLGRPRVRGARARGPSSPARSPVARRASATSSSSPGPAPPSASAGIESGHRHVDRAAPGARVALNLAGVERRRSSAVTHSCGRASGRSTSVVDVALAPEPGWSSRRGRAGCRPTSGPASTTCGPGPRRRRRLRARHASTRRSRSRPATTSCSATPAASRRSPGATVLDVDPRGRRATRAARLAPAGRASGCSPRTAWLSRRQLRAPHRAGARRTPTLLAACDWSRPASRRGSTGGSSTGRELLDRLRESRRARRQAAPRATAGRGLELATLAQALAARPGAGTTAWSTGSTSSSSTATSCAPSRTSRDRRASPEGAALLARARRVAVLATRRRRRSRADPALVRVARPRRRPRRHRRDRLHAHRPSTTRASSCAMRCATHGTIDRRRRARPAVDARGSTRAVARALRPRGRHPPPRRRPDRRPERLLNDATRGPRVSCSWSP